MRGGPDIVPQPYAAYREYLSCARMKIAEMRNFNRSNKLIYMRNIVDCKSAYAGSIPTSASTLGNPVD